MSMLNFVKESLSSCFDMKDLGEATHILGINLLRYHKLKILDLSQTIYIDTILVRFSMQNSKEGFFLLDMILLYQSISHPK